MIKAMISSTVSDLVADRDAASNAIADNHLFSALGVGIGQQSSAASPLVTTRKMADECDLYILILGERYGYEAFEGKSATEVEFDAAYRSDPTKIIIFRKNIGRYEPKQKAFIDRVSNYNSGYWYNSYEHTHILRDMITQALNDWVVDRCKNRGVVARDESFLRLAADMRPRLDLPMRYSVTDSDLELRFQDSKRDLQSHFSRDNIARDFWGSLADLQSQVYNWERNG